MFQRVLSNGFVICSTMYKQCVHRFTCTSQTKPIHNFDNTGDVGGTMGLFLGASIMTVAEIFEFFILRPLCRKRVPSVSDDPIDTSGDNFGQRRPTSKQSDGMYNMGGYEEPPVPRV